MASARTGRRPTISREALEQAVIEVGFDQATTTAIARHLGVDQSSLYRHIASRDDLILGAIHRVFASYDFDPAADDWRDYLRRLADTLWSVLRDHPGLASCLFELDTVPAESMAIMVSGVRRLMQFDWSLPDAVLILDSISDMTGDTINQIETFDRSDRLNWDDLADTIAAVESSGLEREIRTFLATHMHEDPYLWWRRKLDLLIAGAEHRASPPAAG